MTGARTLRPTATHIGRLLDDLTLLAGPTLPAGMTLDIANHMPDQAVLLDSGLVQDGLLNLILNARDACGGAGRIMLEVKPVHETWIECTIRDTGPGFPSPHWRTVSNPSSPQKVPKVRGWDFRWCMTWSNPPAVIYG